MNGLICTVLLALVAQAAAQCSTTQNANCANWVKNGFCNNAGYSLAQKQSYCGQSCGLCSASGQPIAPGGCTDGNANCANWVKNGFCTNSFYTEAQRKQYCCQSCGLGSATTATSTGTTTAGGSTTTAASTTTTTP